MGLERGCPALRATPGFKQMIQFAVKKDQALLAR